MKMMQLTDELLSEHYAHLSSKPFFQRVKDSMMTAPVIVVVSKVWMLFKLSVCCGSDKWTSGCPGNYSGDYSMSFQENIVHASDSPETAAIELTRFFKPEEIFDYKQATFDYLYANDEY